MKSLISSPRYICFDAFGTLFDVSWKGISDAAIDSSELDKILSTWRTKQLQSTWLMNSMGIYKPFEELSGEALEKAFAIHNVESTDLFERILQQVLKPGLYQDVLPALDRLVEEGAELAILSNGSSDMLASVVASSGIGDHIREVISVDDVEVFKPAPEVYAQALYRLNADSDDLLFVSSNQWDLVGAMYAGLQTTWINRNAATWEDLEVQPGRMVGSLTELAGVLAG